MGTEELNSLIMCKSGYRSWRRPRDEMILYSDDPIREYVSESHLHQTGR